MVAFMPNKESSRELHMLQTRSSNSVSLLSGGSDLLASFCLVPIASLVQESARI